MFKRREVRLNDYLPQVIGDAQEIGEINRVEDLELEALWKGAEKLYFNRWILSCDNDGLKRYETILGLKSIGGLEERRRKVFFEWNKQIVYTDRSLRQIMSNLLGSDGFEMVIKYSEYMLCFDVLLRGEFSLPGIFRELRQIIPANLGIRMGVFTQSDIVFNSLFEARRFPFFLSGEHDCGTIPWYVNRGVQFESGIVINIKSEDAKQGLMFASENTILNKQLINPCTGVDDELIIDSSKIYGKDVNYPALESAGYF